MEIKFELNEKQAEILTEVLAKLGGNLTPEEFCKKAALGIIIQNKQQMLAEELSK